jgi:SAM-dependent methyltransferase
VSTAPAPSSRTRFAGFDQIAIREGCSDRYWARQDPIGELRCWWRAQTARHTFHILPGETILELGCGSGTLTRQLARATRGECPITAATFGETANVTLPESESAAVSVLRLTDFPGELAGKTFDYVIATNILDAVNTPTLMQHLQELLKPGGRFLLFESNPWNPIFWLRRALCDVLPFLRRGDEREIPHQVALYQLLSELGYIRLTVAHYDFLFRPIPAWAMRTLRNLSLIFENTPILKMFAGTVLVHGQLPPKNLARPDVRMVEHKELHRAISVVVPCHNEEMNVGPLCHCLLKHYDEYIYELVLVDDNSRDGTRAELERLAEHEPRVKPIYRTPPNGVGRALSDGLRAATGRYVLLMDCDFTQILPELRDMFDLAAQGADVVLGSRFSREGVLVNYPLQKILCNRAFHLLASLAFHRRLRDFTNNLKLLRREVVDNLDLEAAWFAANAETGLKPLLMGFDVQPSPISWINRTPEMGQSSFSLLNNGLGYARVLIELMWKTRCGFRLLPRKGRSRPGPAETTADMASA